MNHSPKAAGKSSFQLIDTELLLNTLSIKPGMTVLDAASGPGHYLTFLAEKVPGAQFYGMDLWYDGLKQTLDNHFGNIEVVNADLFRELPLNYNTVDLVLMATFFHDIYEKDRHNAIALEIFGMIKPGGRFAVLEFKKEQTEFGPPLKIRLHPGDLDRILMPIGFQKIKSVDIGVMHYMSVYAKPIPDKNNVYQ